MLIDLRTGRPLTMGFGLSTAVAAAIKTGVANGSLPPSAAPPPPSGPFGAVVNAVTKVAVERGIIPAGVNPFAPKPGGFVGALNRAGADARARLASVTRPPNEGPPPLAPVRPPPPAVVPAAPMVIPHCPLGSSWDPVSQACQRLGRRILPPDGNFSQPAPQTQPAPAQATPAPTPAPTPTPGPTPSPQPIVIDSGGTPSGVPNTPTGQAPGGGGGGGSLLDTSAAPGALATTTDGAGKFLGLSPVQLAIGAGVVLAGWYYLRRSQTRH